MEHLTATAKGFEKYHPRLVASDGLRVSVIEKLQEQKSSFAFLEEPKKLHRSMAELRPLKNTKKL